VLKAHGARWKGLHYHGHWRRHPDPLALEDVVMTASRGASVSARLGAGRPVFAVFSGSRSARVELREHGSRRVVVLHRRGRGTGPAVIALPASQEPGSVTMRVLGGEVELDGVGDAPLR